jgi:hypothetical protein
VRDVVEAGPQLKPPVRQSVRDRAELARERIPAALAALLL